MSANDREAWIARLAADAAPVKGVRLNRSAVMWLAAAALTVGLAMLLIAPIRPDGLHATLESPALLVELGMALLAAALLTLTAFASAVPGTPRRSRLLWVSSIVWVLWSSLLVWSWFHPALPPSMLGKRPYCWIEGPFLALLLATTGMVFIRARLWPLRPLRIGLALGLAAGVITAEVLQVLCMYDPTHGLHSHWLPGVLAGLASGVVATLALRPRG